MTDESKAQGATPNVDLAPEVNPLDSVRSRDALMSLDPLKMTDGDVDEVIACYRRDRALWAKAEAAKPAARSATPKAPRGSIKDISLDDLDLGG